MALFDLDDYDLEDDADVERLRLLLEDRVEAGWEWLDRGLGEDWPWHIDTARLALDESCACVLGQTVGHIMSELDLTRWSKTFWLFMQKDPFNYNRGKDAEKARAWIEKHDLLLTIDQSVALGFNLGEREQAGDQAWGLLTSIWRDRIVAWREAMGHD